jgi:hypothetical protein
MGEAKRRRSRARVGWEEARREGHALGDGPVEEEYHDKMKAIAQGIDEFFNGDGPKKIGYVLMTFNFEDEGRCNYMSNADRRDIITLMKEMLARFEGQPEIKGRA